MSAQNQVQNNKPSLYWINKKYEPGFVYNSLTKSAEYDMVIAIDIGHGECVAFGEYKNEAGQLASERLIVTDSGDKVAATYMVYTNNGEKVTIGKSATDLEGRLLTYFKEEPEKWEAPSADNVHTYGKVLEDFIRELWRWIYEKNHKLQEIDKSKVLIAIGCPSSSKWTENRERYIDLVKEATGYPSVTILEESTAAILSVIYSKSQVIAGNFDPGKGVAVYDLGSSTLDFTFILMGKVLVTRSLRIGGSNIDQAMLRKIAKVSAEEQRGFSNWHEKCTELRERKETFYRSGGTTALRATAVELKRSINVLVDDHFVKAVLQQMGLSDTVAIGQGNDAFAAKAVELVLGDSGISNITVKSRDSVQAGLLNAAQKFLQTRKPVNADLSISQSYDYQITEGFMDAVLTEDTAVSAELDAPYRGKSWRQCIDTFFESTQDLIKDYLCEKVVLTGGTSGVTCVQKIAENYYGADKVHREEDPSVSVAMGLVKAKAHEIKAAALIEGARKYIKGTEMKPQFEQLCWRIAYDVLFDVMWNLCAEAAEIMAESGKTYSYASIENTINKWIEENRKGVQSDIQEKVSASIKKHIGMCSQYSNCPQEGELKQKCSICDKNDSCAEQIRKQVNDISKQVYQVQADALPAVPSDIVLQMTNSLQGDSLKNAIHNMKVGTMAQNAAIDFAFKDNSGVVRGIRKLVKSFTPKEKREFTPVDCKAMADAFKNDQIKAGKKHWYSCDLKFALIYDKEFREAFNGLLDELLELALGTVLFQVFEKVDMQ